MRPRVEKITVECDHHSPIEMLTGTFHEKIHIYHSLSAPRINHRNWLSCAAAAPSGTPASTSSSWSTSTTSATATATRSSRTARWPTSEAIYRAVRMKMFCFYSIWSVGRSVGGFFGPSGDAAYYPESFGVYLISMYGFGHAHVCICLCIAFICIRRV